MAPKKPKIGKRDAERRRIREEEAAKKKKAAAARARADKQAAANAEEAYGEGGKVLMRVSQKNGFGEGGRWHPRGRIIKVSEDKAKQLEFERRAERLQ